MACNARELPLLCLELQFKLAEKRMTKLPLMNHVDVSLLLKELIFINCRSPVIKAVNVN